MQHQTIQATPGQQAIPGASGPTVFVMVDNEKKQTSFAKKLAISLSIVQIILGITSFLAQVVIIILLSTYDSHRGDYGCGIGEGIYCGVFFIIAGGLGVLASRKPTKCCISAFMTLSIIASIISCIQIILASIKLGILSENYFSSSTPSETDPTINMSNQHGDEPDLREIPETENYYGREYTSIYESKMVMVSIIVLAGAVESIVAIVCAAICCGACCCSGNGSSAGKVVYLAQGEYGLGAVPVQMAGGVPIQMPGGVPVQMVGSVPVQMAGSVPVQIPYLPQANPFTGDKQLNELLSYGDAVRGDEQETKDKYLNGGYMRVEN